jgi:hypothetical protein
VALRPPHKPVSQTPLETQTSRFLSQKNDTGLLGLWELFIDTRRDIVAHEVKGNTVLRNWSPDAGRERRSRMLGN